MDTVIKQTTLPEDQALAQLQQSFARQQQAFLADMVPSRAVRHERLQRLLQMTEKYGKEIADTISADFGNRSPHLTRLSDTMLVEAAVKHAQRHLRGWMRTRRAPTAIYFMPGSNAIMRQPLGVVGIIAPWNYPYQLAMSPAVGAIAAGNRVMIKPSELTPRFSALLEKIVAEFFKPEEMIVINGDAQVGRAFSELPFDHLLFTGSTQVGRMVAQAAARNLTPVTLELGGKSPVIFDASADMAEMASRVAHGKLFNGGQTCVAPDYVFVPKNQLDSFVAGFSAAVGKMYPTLASNPDYTSVVSERHFTRLQGLRDEARAMGAKIVEINPAQETLVDASRKLAPTLIIGATEQMRVMREEIFGPLLPVLTYDNIDQAISYVNAHDRPLALYFMGTDSTAKQRVLNNTIAGGMTVNDCIWHFGQEDVP
ncbi:MAG: hypothetical protein RL748_2607, partial [Pseudomonadota bacterium]